MDLPSLITHEAMTTDLGGRGGKKSKSGGTQIIWMFIRAAVHRHDAPVIAFACALGLLVQATDYEFLKYVLLPDGLVSDSSRRDPRPSRQQSG